MKFYFIFFTPINWINGDSIYKVKLHLLRFRDPSLCEILWAVSQNNKENNLWPDAEITKRNGGK